MGQTRPRRVHGVANLYVARAAVFPTAGCVNPTFTLVALTSRLSDHLKGNIA
jgi:choline dehydrogenase-like flavoprotein